MPRSLSHLEGVYHIPWKPNVPIDPRVSDLQALFGTDPYGKPLQVLVGKWNSSSAPTKELCLALFTTYKARQVFPLVLALEGQGDNVFIFGPNDSGSVVGPLTASQAFRILQAALNEPLGTSARNLIVRYFDSLSATSMPGVTNSGLFASYYLRNSTPERKDWKEMMEIAEPLLSLRGEALIKDLGFQTSWEGSSAVLLKSTSDVTRAIAVLLEDSESFSQASSRFIQSPVAFGLAFAQSREVSWLIALKGPQIRLYSTNVTEGVGRKGQSETFFELDLAVIDDNYKALLPLIFSANALGSKGTAEELLRESDKYAVSLGKRLRNRVYELVIPKLSVGVATQVKAHGIALDKHGLDLAYAATLRILFRLLFQAYGEDRSLLPYGKNSTYDRHALKTIAQELAKFQGDSFDDKGDSYYQELSTAWRVIDRGDTSWGVPAYNGGLFSSEDEEGELLAQISLPNSIFAQCLKALLVDETEDGTIGPVDFRSLSVREFGTIYEGLLESSLSLAEVDLTLDKSATWIPAKEGDVVEARRGEPYFHNASGARKSTGSYFTPSFLVEHLIEHSLLPALDDHLGRVKEVLDQDDQPRAAKMFFDFRVADLAMGSGHFLVSAIDRIQSKMTAFLVDNPIPEIDDELRRLEYSARDALGEFSQDIEIESSSLLRRQIARRCIYGLDTNKIAVELARVAIWIHTFVPGLAMSSLDHGLVHGNSLTGIGTIEEALNELDPPKKGQIRGSVSLFRQDIEDVLTKAADLLSQAAAASEATALDVAEANRISAKAKAESAPSKALFDVAIAIRLGILGSASGTNPKTLEEKANHPDIKQLISTLNPAHMPYLFPEVFLRERSGFDVLVGNPPWEEVKIDAQRWWCIQDPGLMGMNQNLRNARIEVLKSERPDLAHEFEMDLEQTSLLKDALMKGPFPGFTTGDPDLYKAFGSRYLQVIADGGYVGVVLPRGALIALGSAEWRNAVLSGHRFADVCVLQNHGEWLFENVHEQYTLALVTIQNLKSDSLSFSGPFRSMVDYISGKDHPMKVDVDWFQQWTSDLSFPMLPDAASYDVFLSMRRHPRFDSAEQFEFRPHREFDMTNDQSLWSDITGPGEGLVEVLSSAAFDVWNPDAGYPFAYAPKSKVVEALRVKLRRQIRLSSSAFFNIPAERTELLPFEKARIAFASRTNSTNQRTMSSCLVPPNVALTNAAPYFVQRSGDPTDEAYVLGVLCSVPFDWYARKFVDQNFNFFILTPMPIPRPPRDDVYRMRVVEIAGRLAAIDERYSDWASEVGVGVGTVNSQGEKDDLISELDAVVAHLYGLSSSQLIHIFETFHIGWAYEARLKAVLAHFKAWEGRS